MELDSPKNARELKLGITISLILSLVSLSLFGPGGLFVSVGFMPLWHLLLQLWKSKPRTGILKERTRITKEVKGTQQERRRKKTKWVIDDKKKALEINVIDDVTVS